MDPFDASTLPGLPAPFWFVELFKVLGFTLHMVPMHLWYAGAVLALGLYAWGGRHEKRFGARLMLQMPVLVALGINLGIVPLLFLQVGYSKAFYPATILMAWFWLAIVGLLIPAYYGVYLYAFGLRDEGVAMTPIRRAAGWGAAAMFLAIGFLFANGLSLTGNPGAWPKLWQAHSFGGAATGTALNLADATLWPRWLLMFGLALVTTAAWAVVDAAWLAPRDGPEYRRWAQSLSRRVALAGSVWATIAGAWYVLVWPKDTTSAMLGFPTVLLTLLTAASPWLPAALLWLGRRVELSRRRAAAIGAAQLAVLALNAVSRQIVQNVEVHRLYDVSAQPTAVQWGPMALFLVTLLAGAAVVGWILAQVLKARS